MHEVPVKRLGGLPRKSMDRITDRPTINLAVYANKQANGILMCARLILINNKKNEYVMIKITF